MLNTAILKLGHVENPNDKSFPLELSKAVIEIKQLFLSFSYAPPLFTIVLKDHTSSRNMSWTDPTECWTSQKILHFAYTLVALRSWPIPDYPILVREIPAENFLPEIFHRERFKGFQRSAIRFSSKSGARESTKIFEFFRMRLRFTSLTEWTARHTITHLRTGHD